MDTPETLHIRCGSDIKAGLRDAGFAGGFLEFSDPFCQGPITDAPRESHIAARAAFIAGAYETDAVHTHSNLKAGYGALDGYTNYNAIVLWFEHDSYDQLILAYLLNYFSNAVDVPSLELICIHEHKDIPDFRGLGQLSPSQLKALWPTKVKVEQEHLDLGAEVWRALKAQSPKALAALSKGEHTAVQEMPGALVRHLQQLPHGDTGLSLTEELTLKILADSSRTAGKVFRQLTLNEEPLPYLGDLMFWYELRQLVAGGAVSIVEDAPEWPGRMLAITELGLAVLCGERYWLDYAPAPRWVGGIEIKPITENWCRTEDGGTLFK
ncbi:MAG: hypothetical protein COB37_12340 [Kordiimonadales bacterium]|nr:MAG: hypothetical protein COB37_12340 [Kordiimonadales bacterium]